MKDRGLTLVETLAATALLSLLAIMVAGLCTDSARAGARTPTTTDSIVTVAAAADVLMADPGAMRPIPQDGRSVELRSDGLELKVRRNAAADRSHEWVSFTHGGLTVVRWRLCDARGSDR